MAISYFAPSELKSLAKYWKVFPKIITSGLYISICSQSIGFQSSYNCLIEESEELL
jgi:adenosine deaminase